MDTAISQETLPDILAAITEGTINSFPDSPLPSGTRPSFLAPQATLKRSSAATWLIALRRTRVR